LIRTTFSRDITRALPASAASASLSIIRRPPVGPWIVESASSTSRPMILIPALIVSSSVGPVSSAGYPAFGFFCIGGLLFRPSHSGDLYVLGRFEVS
jgi:hypothetical protein